MFMLDRLGASKAAGILNFPDEVIRHLRLNQVGPEVEHESEDEEEDEYETPPLLSPAVLLLLLLLFVLLRLEAASAPLELLPSNRSPHA
jgi:hypothetical protein